MCVRERNDMQEGWIIVGCCVVYVAMGLYGGSRFIVFLCGYVLLI